MPRTKSQFVVLHKTGPDDYVFEAGGMGSTKEARQHLRDCGAQGETYQIAAFRGGPVTVEVTPITRRKLVDAAQPTAAPDTEQG